MAKAKQKEIKLEFSRDGNDCVCARIYLVNEARTKRYMVTFSDAPGAKVIAAKSYIKGKVAEWLQEHPEWVRVEKEVYDSVKVIW